MAMVLGGCAAAPTAPPPATGLPSHWHAARGADPGDAAVAPDAWWDGFGDPVLSELVAEALAAAPDLRLARARVLEARAAAGIARADALPRIDAGASSAIRADVVEAERQGRPSEQAGFHQIGFDARWEIDLFGGLRARRDAAAADLAAAGFAYADARVTLAAEVGRHYIALRGAQRRLEVARSNLARQRDALGLLRSRVRAGLDAEVDGARAQSELQALQAALPPLRAESALAALRIAVLLGRPPAALAQRLGEAQPLPPVPAAIPAGVPSSLLDRRPDLRRARAEVLAANARVGMARADLFPRFFISGLLARSGERLDGVTLGPGLLYSLGPSVTLPIFNAGRLRANVEIQDARLAQAIAGYDRAVLRALEDVEAASTAFARERERHERLTEAVRSAALAERLARTLHGRGLADWFGVLDAQRVLYAREDALAASATALGLHAVALYKALGGGWDAAPEGSLAGLSFP